MGTKPVYIAPPTIKTPPYAPSMVQNLQATSPVFSDADTFAGSLSPAPSSVHSPPWNGRPLASPTQQHARTSSSAMTQQQSQRSRYQSTSPAFDSDAALPATPASGYLLPQPFLSPSSMSHQQAWGGVPGAVLMKQNNGVDLAMLRGDGVIDGATTSPSSSPGASDDYTRFIDLDTLNDPYSAFPLTSSASGIGIGIDDQCDGQTTWKQGQIPTITSTSSHRHQQQPRIPLADMFPEYISSPLPPSNGDAQPQTIAAITATSNNGNINEPTMSSSFTDSATTAWSGSAYGSPYLTFAAAGMMGGLPASDPGAVGGLSAFSPGTGLVGGAGSSVPTWFASLPSAMQNGAVSPIASPSQHPQMHQQQHFLPTSTLSHQPQYSQPPQSHAQHQQQPSSFQQQHSHHAFTFSSPSALSASLSQSDVSTSFDNFDALLGSYSSSSGVSGLGRGDLGIAPNLIHHSPPPNPHHSNAHSPFAQQQSLYLPSYEVPWDSGVMEGVDDVTSPRDANALGLGLDGVNGALPHRGRRMRRTTVRAAVSPMSPNFAFAHANEEDMDSNASTRHDDGSDNDDGEASDEDGARDDGADSEDDYDDDEYRPGRPVRRQGLSHANVNAHAGALSFSPPAISTSAPATSAARDIAANALTVPDFMSNSRVGTRRQSTIRGAPGSTRATTTSATTTGITIHTANGITYASLPSASSAPSDGMSAAHLAANLIGGPGSLTNSMTKRSRGRQVPTVRLVDVPTDSNIVGSSSRSPVRPASNANNSEEVAATSERSTSSRARRRSRLASEAAADEDVGSYGEGASGVSQNDDDDSEYDENGTGTSSARSGRLSGAGGRSVRASTRNARNTRRKVKASTSLATLHAGSVGGAAGGPGVEDIIVGGIGAGNMNWSDGRTRSYVCRVNGCGKCFQRGEHLKRHIRSIHTNEKRMCHFFPLNMSMELLTFAVPLCSLQVPIPRVQQRFQPT